MTHLKTQIWIRSFSLRVNCMAALHYCYLLSLLHEGHYSQFVRTCGCFVSSILLQICNRITTSTMLYQYWHYLNMLVWDSIIQRTYSSKAATCSEELTCCNARHGTATTDNNNAKQPCNSQGMRTNNSYLQFCLCHSIEVLKTMYIHCQVFFYINICGFSYKVMVENVIIPYISLIVKGIVDCV